MEIGRDVRFNIFNQQQEVSLGIMLIQSRYNPNPFSWVLSKIIYIYIFNYMLVIRLYNPFSWLLSKMLFF